MRHILGIEALLSAQIITVQPYLRLPAVTLYPLFYFRDALLGIYFTMSTILATTTHAVSSDANRGSSAVLAPHVKSPVLYTVDDLLFSRSQTIPDVHLVAYPATARGKADYAHYTARDLDRFADHGALKYSSLGLKPKACLLKS